MATPSGAHLPAVLAALRRGVHVICEKPLAMSAREAREMTEAAERAGVTTMVPFTYRFMPTNRYVKELVDSGELGDVACVYGNRQNLGVIRSMCDRVGVMYAGRVVEEGRSAEVFESPRHPYTQALLSVVPDIGRTDQIVLTGYQDGVQQVKWAITKVG